MLWIAPQNQLFLACRKFCIKPQKKFYLFLNLLRTMNTSQVFSIYFVFEVFEPLWSPLLQCFNFWFLCFMLLFTFLGFKYLSIFSLLISLVIEEVFLSFQRCPLISSMKLICFFMNTICALSSFWLSLSFWLFLSSWCIY